MELKVLRPIYLKGEVVIEGKTFETDEQHGRELIKKGYAVAITDKTTTQAEAEAAETKANAEAEAQAKAEAAETEAKAKTK